MRLAAFGAGVFGILLSSCGVLTVGLSEKCVGIFLSIRGLKMNIQWIWNRQMKWWEGYIGMYLIEVRDSFGNLVH